MVKLAKALATNTTLEKIFLKGEWASGLKGGMRKGVGWDGGTGEKGM